MTESAVRKLLREDPNRPKTIRLDNGRSIRVRGVEYWAVADTYLVVMLRNDGLVSLPYRKIASIHKAPARAARKRK